MFAFPVVVGQRREERIGRNVTRADGRKGIIFERITLERRMMGMAPVAAEDDDLPAPSERARNRRACIAAAGAGGYYWQTAARFAPAAVSGPAASARFSNLPDWGEGEATVAFFPGHAMGDVEGLLLRVTLTNRSNRPQTYFVDLLGGMDESALPNFLPADFQVETDESGVLLRHTRCLISFALVSNSARFPLRFYKVGRGYFAPEAATSPRPPTGIIPPPGRISEKDNRPEEKKEKSAKRSAPAPDTWGLLRIDDILLAPGESAQFALCIGAGRNTEAAQTAAFILLRRMEDLRTGNKRDTLPGIETLAQQEHQSRRFVCPNSALNALMTHSFVNVCYDLLRRVGVPSRQGTAGVSGGQYQAEAGGMLALAWIHAQPNWAAAQLNAFFLTHGAPGAPIKDPQAVPPTNLFALWELYQRTHDRALLERFYPFAARRYRELLAAGRLPGREWLFAWPDASPVKRMMSRAEAGAQERDVFSSQEQSDLRLAAQVPPAPKVVSPDYSAYVIRSAQLLRMIAAEVRAPAEEQAAWEKDIAEASRAMNDALWSPQRTIFVPRPAMAGGPDSAPDTLAGLLPFITGSAISPEHRAALLKHLTDPATFWSEFGVRSVSKASPQYRAFEARYGGIHFQFNWMLWKALLDFGEVETARKLADNLLLAYTRAFETTGGCPEWLDGDTGVGCGADDYTGESGALFSLFHAYRTPGTVTTGWDINLIDHRYDKGDDSLRIVFRPGSAEGRGALICVLGKPEGRYVLSGGLAGMYTADRHGALTFFAPKSNTLQQVTITPAPGTERK